MEHTNMQVTIVIPNYNGKEFLEMCLPSLAAQIYRDFEVVIVDNASEDDSLPYLIELGDHLCEDIPLTVIPMDENTGFSRAVNEGIHYAEKVKSPYVLLLNNDTTCDPHFVGELVRSISTSKRTFAAASRMIKMYEPDKLDSAGDMYTLLGWAYNRGGGRSIDTFPEPGPVFSVCAGAAIYRTRAFARIGYFDEVHFAYLEDLDICYRARLYGYQNLYAPAAKVFHVGSGTSGSKYNDFKVRLAARNSIYLIYKNMPTAQIVINAPFLLLGILIKFIFFMLKGFGKGYMDGIKEGFETCHTLHKVPFRFQYLLRYLEIEKELIVNLYEYVTGWFTRAMENR